MEIEAICLFLDDDLIQARFLGPIMMIEDSTAYCLNHDAVSIANHGTVFHVTGILPHLYTVRLSIV